MIITKNVTRFNFCDPAILKRLSNTTLQGIASPGLYYHRQLDTKIYLASGNIGFRSGVTLQNISDFLPVTSSEAREKLGITDQGFDVSKLHGRLKNLEVDDSVFFNKVSNNESGHRDYCIDLTTAVGIAVKIGDPARVLNPNIGWMPALTFGVCNFMIRTTPIYIQEREEVFSKFLRCLNYDRPFLAGFVFRQLWDVIFRAHWGDERLQGEGEFSIKAEYEAHLKDITVRVINRLYPFTSDENMVANQQEKLQALAGVAAGSDLPPGRVFSETAASWIAESSPEDSLTFNLAFIELDEARKPIFDADVMLDVLSLETYFNDLDLEKNEDTELTKLITCAKKRYPQQSYKQYEFIVLMVSRKVQELKSFKNKIELLNNLAQLMNIAPEELLSYLFVAPLVFQKEPRPKPRPSGGPFRV